jgi:hypothetical protein
VRLVASAAFVAGLSVLPAAAAFPEAPALGKLTFDVEWRLIRAGSVSLEAGPNEGRIRIESAGLVTTLYKVDDTYIVHYDRAFCAADTLLDAKEGRRHRETMVTYDRRQNRAIYLERDLTRNEVLRSTQVEIPNCVHEVLGGLMLLRGLTIEPGQTAQVPVSDGRKFAQVRVESQAREEIKNGAGTFKTVRYEVNLMNGVIYGRKGRVFVWVTDDEKRLPVKLQLRLSFPIGTVTLDLRKQEPN